MPSGRNSFRYRVGHFRYDQALSHAGLPFPRGRRNRYEFPSSREHAPRFGIGVRRNGKSALRLSARAFFGLPFLQFLRRDVDLKRELEKFPNEEVERIRARIQVDVRSSGIIVLNFQTNRAVRGGYPDEPVSEVSARSSSDVGIVEIVRRRCFAASADEYDFPEGSAGKVVLADTTVKLVIVRSDRHCRGCASEDRSIGGKRHVERHGRPPSNGS